VKSDKIRSAVVIGMGTMGPGIAQCFAQAGITVRLYARTREHCDKGLADIQRNLEVFAEHSLLPPEEVPTVLGRITSTTDLTKACAGTDFVVEAAPESLELKQSLFAQLDNLCPPHAILASNTSGLSISAMAEATERPEKVVGTHFWNPPHLLPLVEVVRGIKTSPETLDLANAVMIRLGKRPVIVHKEVPGFVGTRLHQALIREAFHIAEQGIASLEDIDTVVKCSFGRRLAVTGPFETCDLGGLDVFLAAAEVWSDLSNKAEEPGLMVKKVANGDLGAKTGQGLYAWNQESLEKIVNQRERELIRHLQNDQTANHFEEKKK